MPTVKFNTALIEEVRVKNGDKIPPGDKQAIEAAIADLKGVLSREKKPEGITLWRM